MRTTLLIEDSSDEGELMLLALKAQKIEGVIWFQDAHLAIDYLFARGSYAGRKDAQPALIILDLQLGPNSGLDLLARIRGNPSTRTIPVVVLTTSSRQADIQTAYRMGVNSYLKKPVDFHAFQEMVRALSKYWLELNEISVQPPPSE